MIEQLCEEDFLCRLGTSCRITSGDIAFDLLIESVSPYKHTIPAYAARIPFSVQLTGPLQPSFQYGIFTLEMQEYPMIENIYIERVTAPFDTAHKHLAYYQIIFA
jgi:hypothetical protein